MLGALLMFLLLLVRCIPTLQRGVYDISVRSMNIDNWPTDDRPHTLEHFKWPYLCSSSFEPHHVWILVGFQGLQIEQRYFWMDQIQDAGRWPFWKFRIVVSWQRVIQSTSCVYGTIRHCWHCWEIGDILQRVVVSWYEEKGMRKQLYSFIDINIMHKEYTGWAKKVSLVIFAITLSTASQFS